MLTVYLDNGTAGLPVHQAVIAVFDPATGRMLGLMDGDHLTAARTAACSALSVRHLARSDAEVLAVLGTGPQAHEHARYACLVHPFAEVRIGGRDPEKAAALAGELAQHDRDDPARVTVFKSVGVAVQDAAAASVVLAAAQQAGAGVEVAL